MAPLRMKCSVAGINMGDGMAISQINIEPPDPRNPHITAVLPKSMIEFEAGEVYEVTFRKVGK